MKLMETFNNASRITQVQSKIMKKKKYYSRISKLKNCRNAVLQPFGFIENNLKVKFLKHYFAQDLLTLIEKGKIYLFHLKE